MRARRHALPAVLVCVAAVTACAAASELPTFEAATRRLDADAGELIRATELHLSAVRRADDATCVPGQMRHFVQAESDRAGATDGLVSRLRALGYDQVVDDLDLRDDDQDVAVLRHPRTRLEFELTVLSGERGGVRVVGRTTCYATE
ncbi:hypothetical protein [Nonomuraea gerenzanensis]|uniref:Lipoprotein n=1 Tax=Nonomuraea gerenzanensis TaxID=93944 RepID=A0A1M4EN19_9ACTN|nr:hypothetical protein [Nonomuraea gerenzanensis]UBU11754.1 hypothetical protein LCN96_46870 [Nonomuraea gerenzanensis]SBP00256.1 hypothetical protein BN4615_P9772 [Nonomuraea gerenzanensis]